jgi:hypothetical protein
MSLVMPQHPGRDGGRGPPRKGSQLPGKGHTATGKSHREKWNTKLRARATLEDRSRVRFLFYS